MRIYKLSLLLVLWTTVLNTSCQSEAPLPKDTRPLAAEESALHSRKKINGVCFAGPSEVVADDCMQPIAGMNANWVAFSPYAFANVDAPALHWEEDWQWWGEKKVGITRCIELAQKEGMKVMIKPHLWIQHMFTGDYELQSDEEWLVWEENYKKYILEYALLAQQESAEALCIGTELKKFVAARPDFWKQLIADVRAIYSGLVTYADNWDSYRQFPHWTLLDFVGIDAYFPLCAHKTPDLDSLKKGWIPHVIEIEKISRHAQRPVLFTEFGYRSVDHCAHEPWQSGRHESINLQSQNNALQAIFDVFWDKEWFAGGFVWKWHHNHTSSGGPQDNQFTPQNKPAEEVIRAAFAKY